MLRPLVQREAKKNLSRIGVLKQKHVIRSRPEELTTGLCRGQGDMIATEIGQPVLAGYFNRQLLGYHLNTMSRTPFGKNQKSG